MLFQSPSQIGMFGGENDDDWTSCTVALDMLVYQDSRPPVDVDVAVAVLPVRSLQLLAVVAAHLLSYSFIRVEM